MAIDRDKDFNWKEVPEKAWQILGDDFWGDINRVLPRLGPSADMYMMEKDVVVIVEVPGVASTDKLSVNLNGFKLILSGEIPWIYPVPEENMVQSERYIGTFRREIKLPADILPGGNVSAKLRNGILEIRIPRLRQDNAKLISVEYEE